jgi:hypothetical protein
LAWLPARAMCGDGACPNTDHLWPPAVSCSPQASLFPSQEASSRQRTE